MATSNHSIATTRTALRRFLNNLVKFFHPVLNPLVVKGIFEEMDFTHCATLLGYMAVVNKSGRKINLFI